MKESVNKYSNFNLDNTAEYCGRGIDGAEGLVSPIPVSIHTPHQIQRIPEEVSYDEAKTALKNTRERQGNILVMEQPDDTMQDFLEKTHELKIEAN